MKDKIFSHGNYEKFQKCFCCHEIFEFEKDECPTCGQKESSHKEHKKQQKQPEILDPELLIKHVEKQLELNLQERQIITSKKIRLKKLIHAVPNKKHSDENYGLVPVVVSGAKVVVKESTYRSLIQPEIDELIKDLNKAFVTRAFSMGIHIHLDK